LELEQLLRRLLSRRMVAVVVVHQVEAAVALLMPDNPRRISEKWPGKVILRADGGDTYSHHIVRGVLHLGLVKLHLLLVQHRFDLCVFPTDDFK